MIDSHCHLDQPSLFNDLDGVLKRAKLNGVKLFLSISTNLNSYEIIKNIIKKYNNVYGTIGIHPHETKNFTYLNKEKIIKLRNDNDKIIAIGETGLDYYYENSDRIIQKKIFIQHIEAAIKLNIPLIIHTRNAEIDTFNILNDYSFKKPKILMHCFTGSYEFSKKLLKLGAYFSFSGIITFNNSNKLQKTALSIPNDKLLIETDSPFLAPVPKRGQANEPSYIKYTAEKLAEIKKVSFNEIIKYTSDNFNKLFSIK
mgnify:CR=1 FL=1